MFGSEAFLDSLSKLISPLAAYSVTMSFDFVINLVDAILFIVVVKTVVAGDNVAFVLSFVASLVEIFSANFDVAVVIIEVAVVVAVVARLLVVVGCRVVCVAAVVCTASSLAVFSFESPVIGDVVDARLVVKVSCSLLTLSVFILVVRSKLVLLRDFFIVLAKVLLSVSPVVVLT